MDTMQGKLKRQWELEGLDCANCAMKIEDKVKKIEGVSSCSVNFVTKTMTLETAAGYEESAIVEAKKMVKALEPHVNVKEKVGEITRRAIAVLMNIRMLTSMDTSMFTIIKLLDIIMVMRMLKVMVILTSMEKVIHAKYCCG